MATKHYLTQNMNYPTPKVGDKLIEFIPAVFMQGTGSDWGTYSTDDAAEQEAIGTMPHLKEITPEDNALYEAQRKKRVDYATIFHLQHRGMATDMKGSMAAITVDEPAAPGPRPSDESMEEILATKVTAPKKK